MRVGCMHPLELHTLKLSSITASQRRHLLTDAICVSSAENMSTCVYTDVKKTISSRDDVNVGAAVQRVNVDTFAYKGPSCKIILALVRLSLPACSAVGANCA